MAKHRPNSDGHADRPDELTPDHFTHDDGSIYVRVDPHQFSFFDNRDSTLIEDPGAPTDAS